METGAGRGFMEKLPEVCGGAQRFCGAQAQAAAGQAGGDLLREDCRVVQDRSDVPEAEGEWVFAFLPEGR